MRYGLTIFTSAIISLLPSLSQAAPSEASPLSFINESLAEQGDNYVTLEKKFWREPELGFKETNSSQQLMDLLRENGFTVSAGVAGIPTAFTAEWGDSGPVIGLLGEYDALPGLSQDAVPERHPLHEDAPGHACGHHLLGVGSLAAAITIKNWLEETGTKGRIRYYGTPAEEGGSGKVYMVRAGLFKDADAVLHWHPGDRNQIGAATSLANISAKFRFNGVAAHAAGSPEKGRSALDAVEAMDYMVNMMREHVPQETRIHYIITKGGTAPNVVPQFAESYYYVRHPEPEVVRSIFERVIKAAEGAALGTGTEFSYEITGGVYPTLANPTITHLYEKNLEKVGGITLNKQEVNFAEKLQASLHTGAPEPIEDTKKVFPLYSGVSSASTDVGDVSWAVPTSGFLSTATWPPGTPAHSWQAVAAGGTDAAGRAMLNATRVMALTAIDLYQDPSLLKTAHSELENAQGKAFKYQPLLGDREPALNYRDN